MAWAIRLDGVNDYIVLDAAVAMGNTSSFTLSATFTYSSNASDQAFVGSLSGSWYIQALSNGSLARKGAVIAASVFSDGLDYDIDFIFTAGVSGASWPSMDVKVNGNTYSAYPSTSLSGALDLLEVFGSVSGLSSSILLKKLELYDDIATLSNNWDATASSHAAGTPVLVDTIGGNNATGVNMPTDGSAWVDLGGGGVTVTALLNSNYMVEYSMKKNVASQSIGAQMVTIADGSDFTGTVTAEVTIDNGTKTAGGGTVTHEGEGYHSYAPTQAETNGDHIAVSFAGTGALTQTIQVYTTFPQTVDNDTKISLIPTTAMRGTDSAATAAQVTALNNFNPAVDTVANVTLVATTTTNTDMVGTNGANTVVPPSVAQFNARTLVSADYFVVTDYTAPDNTSITSILADTNELQLNQGNWLTATGFSTLVATDIVTGGAITTVSGDASVDINKINGVTITGDGSANPFDV